MKITVEAVFSIQYSRFEYKAFGDVYLNGKLVAWIGFLSKVELEAEPGENTIKISYREYKNGSKEIKFYATEDVHIFARVDRVAGTFTYDSVLETLAVGKDLKIIEESGTIK